MSRGTVFTLLRRPGLPLLAVVLTLVALVATAPVGGRLDPRSMSLIEALQSSTGGQVSALGGSATAATQIDYRPASTLTRKGTGEFKDLSITVSQTTNLINQAVSITWKGGKPTDVLSNKFRQDYLQFMQCWGDVEPTPQTCEFGGRAGLDPERVPVGGNVYTRKLLNSPADPGQTIPVIPGQPGNFMPFRAVDGVLVPGNDAISTENPYFNAQTTNEIPWARTFADGTGFQTMEIVTYRESAGLGCGEQITSGARKGQIRNCWLVAVPRGDTEVDGSPAVGGLNRGLSSSPLSATNWAKRIVFPLTFAAGSALCSIKQDQLQVLGSELAGDAVLRWQPALCANNGPSFSYAQLGGAVARRALQSDDPGLQLVNEPLAPDQVPSDRVLRYAPLTVSAVGISVLVERQAPLDAEDRSKDGLRLEDIKLSPRLVAKWLTQSYPRDTRQAGIQTSYLAGNPGSLRADPEFLALNPVFTELAAGGDLPLITPLSNEEYNAVLWDWIRADQQARDFLDGKPDEWGMRVNPFFQGLDLPRRDYPRLDPYCRSSTTDVNGVTPVQCGLDIQAYAENFSIGARDVQSGLTLFRGWRSPVGNEGDADYRPGSWTNDVPQLVGARSLGGVSDSVSMERFFVTPARLRNAAGQYVAPTQAAMKAALGGMRSSGVTGVSLPNPVMTTKGAYPLTVITYGATAPNKLTPNQAALYAQFIRYAVGKGQTPGLGVGQLPPGYLPLPTRLREQALAAATQIAARVGPPATATPRPSASAGATTPAGNSTTPAAGTNPQPVTPQDDATTTAATSAAATPSVTTTTAALQTQATGQRTPGMTAALTRYGLVAALLLGLAALIAGVLLPRLRRRAGGGSA